MMKKLFRLCLLVPFVISFISAGCSGSKATSETGSVNNSRQSYYDTIKAGKYDMGKMWTFDNPPVDYFDKTYGFRPDEVWLDKARKGALKFANYCSASFVSEDGLIMTNHHCGRSSIVQIQKDGEDLLKNGFYAASISGERRVPDLYVDQLILIEDISDRVKSAMDEGKDDQQKVKLRDKRIAELESEYNKKTGLTCRVVRLYNGGKFSMYGYKRYNDIRLVFAPEFQMASTGWDYDNFTYPRYELDFTFFRAYENDRPVKTENYFKWNPAGAMEDEAIFVVGNPGSTGRLQTMAQLEYLRDIDYPETVSLLRGLYNAYFELFQKYPERESELLNMVMSVGNSRKVFEGMLAGLNDQVLMARKRDFERQLIEKVNSDAKLKQKYGKIWDEISQTRQEMREYARELKAYTFSNFWGSRYFNIAQDAIRYANDLSLPAEKRSNKFKQDPERYVNSIYPDNLDRELQLKILANQLEYIRRNLGGDNELVRNLMGTKRGPEAAEYALSRSVVASKDKLIALLAKGPEAIVTSDDPFIKYMVQASRGYSVIQKKHAELTAREQVNNQLLGEAIFDIYGYSIPPDATGTLRISDGVIKGYEYNGTVAPAKTTYYGMYDRYYSFNGKYPWGLSEKWVGPPQDLDLNVPVNFVSTNDIIGGNSGSPVINKKLEIIGLVFDGNIESLPGDFIYASEANRTVAVDSRGLLEAIKDVYKAERINQELTTGKMQK